MNNIILIILAGSALFVYYDASKNKIGKITGEKGFFNLSAGMWSVASLLLWIVVFPAYLIKRSKLIEKAKSMPQESTARKLKLGILGTLLGISVIINISDMTRSALPLNNERKLASSVQNISNEMQKLGEKMKLELGGRKATPKDLRNLINESFSRAGYNYSATLHEMAEKGINIASSQPQVAAFMLLPLQVEGTRPEDAYSGQELEDVRKINLMLRGK